MTPRPLGYATVEEFAQHLDQKLTKKDETAAELYLRMAEEVVGYYTGSREFLPLNPTLAENLADDATTVYLDSIGERLPEGGRLLIGSEIIEYGGRTIFPAKVALTVSSRGFVGTTAAAHTAGDNVTLIRGFRGQGTSIFPGDFLSIRAMWSGPDSYDWQSYDTTYLTPQPYNVLPYQWLECGSAGFMPGALFHIAAVWGYSYSVPYGIKLATMRIAEEVFRRRGGNWTIVTAHQVEAVIQRFRAPTVMPDDVRQLLAEFKRRTV